MVGSILRRTAGGLTVVGLRRSFLPLDDVEDFLDIDVETHTKVGTPFKEFVRLRAVEF